MNFSDSELIATILTKQNFQFVDSADQAEVILINTCSIRDNAEQRIYKRVSELQHLRKKNKQLKIGIVGCMSERIDDEKMIEEGKINFLVGPDSYKNISNVIFQSENERVTDVLLSHTETYEDIVPEKLIEQGISAFVAIMRGCENFCAYCVVPYTRGKERSRPPESIILEIQSHIDKGVAEITLLGQNVNSYQFSNNLKIITFPLLLDELAGFFPHVRFRFATSHPKDLSDELLHIMAKHQNICKSIHLPMQSGSSAVLHRMNRKYSREWYLQRIDSIYEILPGCTISTDIITGFCGETHEDHLETISAMKYANFFHAFMFKYSERKGTAAAKTMDDDVSEEVKSERLTEIIAIQTQLSKKHNERDIGQVFEVLVEGVSKRNDLELMGRTTGNKVVIFEGDLKMYPPGSYAKVKIDECSSATLKGCVV
jgi:tRNA-2-methylthio-N6-dimethylallyladenosine synthase